jgi:hypothetical protein
MTTRTYPLLWPEGWPRTEPHRRLNNDPFKMDPGRIVKELSDEIKRLKATSAVISSNVPVRADGLPYADSARRRQDDPGVAVYFTLKGVQYSMAQDRYARPDANMRSLYLAIAGMRQMERHGGGHMMEKAFSGFAALPDHSGAPRARHWSEVLAVDPRPLNISVAVKRGMIESAWKEAISTAHPDKGGSEEAAQAVNLAREQALAEIE